MKCPQDIGVFMENFLHVHLQMDIIMYASNVSSSLYGLKCEWFKTILPFPEPGSLRTEFTRIRVCPFLTRYVALALVTVLTRHCLAFS